MGGWCTWWPCWGRIRHRDARMCWRWECWWWCSTGRWPGRGRRSWCRWMSSSRSGRAWTLRNRGFWCRGWGSTSIAVWCRLPPFDSSGALCHNPFCSWTICCGPSSPCSSCYPPHGALSTLRLRGWVKWLRSAHWQVRWFLCNRCSHLRRGRRCWCWSCQWGRRSWRWRGRCRYSSCRDGGRGSLPRSRCGQHRSSRPREDSASRWPWFARQSQWQWCCDWQERANGESRKRQQASRHVCRTEYRRGCRWGRGVQVPGGARLRPASSR